MKTDWRIVHGIDCRDPQEGECLCGAVSPRSTLGPTGGRQTVRGDGGNAEKVPELAPLNLQENAAMTNFRSAPEPLSQVFYSVATLRSGQPRAYADTEREYKITVTRQNGKGDGKPWIMHGDVEKRIAEEETLRKAGKMFGGNTPDELRKQQREWAKMMVRTLCQNFREKDDADGRTGMDAHFYPTLKTLKLDAKEGTIHAFIVEPFTD